MQFLAKYYGIIILLLAAVGLIYAQRRKVRRIRLVTNRPFSEDWRSILEQQVKFYNDLNAAERKLFESRIKRFLATKKITAIDTEIDDNIRLLVASSAIIPMFAFPKFNYPNVREILIYPNSFNHKFQTDAPDGKKGTISGMVGNRYLNGTVILSKKNLVSGYNDNTYKNVGIHEFMHMVDMSDGATDGIPEILMKHSYTAPWLQAVKEEMMKIEKGRSRINPYALTNDAEFLAVVSEYFFDKPEKLQKDHPELYDQLARIFNQDPADSESI